MAMKCLGCIHNSTLGCTFGIDRGTTEDFLSKRHGHIACYTEINDFCTEDEITERRINAKKLRKEKMKQKRSQLK